MTDTALIAAILASPEDDAPRLIYADWLDEQGESDRAELIRLQCVLEVHPSHHTAETGCPLRRRERELVARHAVDFIGPVPGLAPFVAVWPEDIGWLRKQSGKNATALRVTLRRGFVAAVSCQAAGWLEHGPEIVSRNPVEEVRISARTPLGSGHPEDQRRWGWFSDDQFSAMPFHCPQEWSISLPYFVWNTEAEALDALNAAALRWARHEAVQRNLVPEGVARAWGVALTKKEK